MSGDYGWGILLSYRAAEPNLFLAPLLQSMSRLSARGGMWCSEPSQTAGLPPLEGGREKRVGKQISGGSYIPLVDTCAPAIARCYKLDCYCIPQEPFGSSQFLTRAQSNKGWTITCTLSLSTPYFPKNLSHGMARHIDFPLSPFPFTLLVRYGDSKLLPGAISIYICTVLYILYLSKWVIWSSDKHLISSAVESSPHSNYAHTVIFTCNLPCTS